MGIAVPDIQFYFQTFSLLEYRSNLPVLCFALENQADLIMSKVFPEVEMARTMIDKAREKNDETVSLFGAVRDGQSIPLGIIYLRQPWRRRRGRTTMDIDSINFYREVYGRTVYATNRVRAAGYTEFVIVLPSQFRPENIKNDRRMGQRLGRFVRTVTEAVVYANHAMDQMITDAPRQITGVTLTHLGQDDREVGNFFQRSISEGQLLGEATGLVRQLTLMPSNLKQPNQFVALATGVKNFKPRTAKSKAWHALTGHGFSSRVKISYLYGKEGIARFGLGLMAGVSRGSATEPVFLKIRYRPKSNRQKAFRRIVVIGKGIIFDTGGTSAKDPDSLERMHYDPAGAAMAIALVKLADSSDLPVEVVALVPIMENTNGPHAIRPHDILTAYDGKTVEVIDTDAEGRLITADAVAYSERRLRKDCTITIGTLGDMSDIGPDLMKIGFGNAKIRRKLTRAETSSMEKAAFLPSIDHLNEVDNEHLGEFSDLVNWPKAGYYDTSAFIFIYNFFSVDRPEWAFVDPSTVFESDADEYGAGPGFGLKFVWYIMKQYA